MEKTQSSRSNNFFRQAILVALTELREQEPEKFVELFQSLPENLTADKIGWLKGETTLKVFWNSLLKHKFIDCDFDIFKTHFDGTNQPESKLIWQANINELAYLFARLREQEIIPLCKYPFLLLQKNFIDKYEKPIKANSLRTLLDKGIRNDTRIEIIENIINIVASLNIKS